MNSECSIWRVLIFGVNFAPGYPRRYLAFGGLVRFSVSTLLLFVVIVALSVGWYVDHNACSDVDEFQNLCMSVTRPEYPTRLNGVSALREHGGTMTLPPLMYALGDPDITIANSARNALEHLTGQSFRSAGTKAADEGKQLDELRNEWGHWIEWFAKNHEDTDLKAPELFKMYVQRSLQASEVFQKQLAR